MRASRAAVVRFFPLARALLSTLWTSSSCLLALTASWYSGRWSKVQPGPKFFLKQVHASMPGWSAQEARKGGHLLDWEHLPMKSECVHTKALTPAQGEPQFSES